MTASTREVLDAIRMRRISEPDHELFATFRPWELTDAESAAGVTPANYAYAPGHVYRYGATGDGVTDDWQAIQNAMDAASGPLFFPAGTYLLSRPLIVRSGGFQNMEFVGASRTNTKLAPYAVDISTAPENVNALIINKDSDGKFSISHMRFWSGIAYTGIGIYAVEGGGDDNLAQAIFSGVMDDCWVDFSSQNTGFFRGGPQNYRFSNITFEFMKGVFFKEGAGWGDVQFDNIVLSNCHDAFIDGTTDTQVGNLTTISNLHVYTHNRGILINVQNMTSLNIQNVQLQASTGAANLGSVGLFRFVNCTNVICDEFISYTNAGFGTGEVDTAITINGSTCRFSNGIIDGAAIGLLTTGTAALVAKFDGVDIINCQTAVWQNETGTTAGRVTVNGCDWSDSQSNLIVFTTASELDVFINHSRILNAGLGGTSGSRNISINTSGSVRITDSRIGQNNVDADAAYYVDANGSGSFLMPGTHFVGTPPVARITGSQTVELFDRGGISDTTVSSASSITLPFDSNFIAIDGTTDITSISATNCGGRRVTLVFAGALTVTDGSNLRLAGNFVTTTHSTLTLACDGSNWFEIARSSNT